MGKPIEKFIVHTLLDLVGTYKSASWETQVLLLLSSSFLGSFYFTKKTPKGNRQECSTVPDKWHHEPPVFTNAGRGQFFSQTTLFDMSWVNCISKYDQQHTCVVRRKILPAITTIRPWCLPRTVMAYCRPQSGVFLPWKPFLLPHFHLLLRDFLPLPPTFCL